MSKILMLSSEVAPYAKSGGLGDVLGALPQALASIGHDVRVMLPMYGSIDARYKQEMQFLFYTYIPLGWRNKYCGVFSLCKNGVTYYFLDNEYYFGGAELYRWDDLERFAFFDKAALEILPKLDYRPDILHLNDWQTGMVPVILKAYYQKNNFYQGIKSVFTIHNLKYQGRYSKDAVADFFSLDQSYFTDDKLEFYNDANLMKAGIVYADIVTTVSPTYAEEIKTVLGGEGLDGLLSARQNDLFGILNGIDIIQYNPRFDNYIEKKYSSDDFEAGKRQNKTALQAQLGLFVDAEKPMLGLVSRLVGQKGLDIIRDAKDELSQFDIQLVILGTGEEEYEDMFRHLAWENSGKISANICFDNRLAHQIYAASDIFLMPSLFEPCGLGQLIAMAYGSVPLVRETGGLKDTVMPFNEFTGEGNGFSFAPPNAQDFLYTLRRALHFYSDKKVWSNLVKRAMEQDFSWGKSAKMYDRIYKKLMGGFDE